MSMAALRWARGVRDISGMQKCVLMVLADMANDHGEAWPSALSIAADCCIDEKTARLALSALEDHGLIVGDRAKGRAARWLLNIGSWPVKAPETTGVLPETPGAAPVLPGKDRPASNPGRSTRTTPGTAPGVPRAEHPGGPGTAPDRTLKNPHRTLTEPSTARAARGDEGVLVPGWLDGGAWERWCAYRRGRKWTPEAQRLSIRTLDRLRAAGNDPGEVIDQSIASGWTGLFAVKRTNGARDRPQSAIAQWGDLLGQSGPPEHFDIDSHAEEMH